MLFMVKKLIASECVSMVNQSSFGLGSSVYGGDAERALKVGKQLKTGMLTVNDFGECL